MKTNNVIIHKVSIIILYIHIHHNREVINDITTNTNEADNIKAKIECFDCI